VSGWHTQKTKKEIYCKMSGDKKLKAKIGQLGRSMVEMLGVLAIVGVLSVGAIAGYSQAMTKHKLNKQAEQLSWLLNIVYQYKSQWVFDDKFVHLVPYYKKLGLIPEEMIKDDSVYIYDALGYRLYIRTNDCPASIDKCRGIIIPFGGQEHIPFEVCQNFFTAAKAFHEQLKGFSTWSDDYGNKHEFFGDKYCTPGKKCLKDITLDQIYEICQTVNSGLNFTPMFGFQIED